MLMGFREYARHRGVTLRAVQKAIAAKRIPIVEEAGKKKINQEQADKAWLESTDPAKQSMLFSAGSTKTSPGTDVEDPDALEEDEAEEPEDQHSLAYRGARAERERIRVERDQIELDQLRGKYIPVVEANRLAFTAFRTLRDAVLNVPARVKDQVAAESDAFTIEQLLDAELTAALESFNPAKVLRDPEDDDAS